MGMMLQHGVHWHVMPWRGALTAEVCEAWDQLAARDPRASVFSLRHWFTLASTVGALDPWGVLVIRQGATPIGLFPLQKTAPGHLSVCDYLTQGGPQLLLDPTEVPATWQGLMAWIRTLPSLCCLTIPGCSDARQVEHLREAGAQTGLSVLVRQDPKPTVSGPLPGTWEGLLASVGAEDAKILTRAETRLYKAYPETALAYVEDPNACQETVDELIALYRRRWSGQLGGCCFDDPRAVLFYRAAMTWAAAMGYGAISTLRIDGRLIAACTLWHLPERDTLYAHFVARDTETIPNRLSPGLVESNNSVRWAMARGATYYDQGIGSVCYKKLYGGKEHPVWHITIARSAFLATAVPVFNRIRHILRRLPVHLNFHSQQAVRSMRGCNCRENRCD